MNITNVRLVCQAKPANYLGSFECDNTMLNRIWYTGAYTVRTNLLENCFGAILMERGDRFSWTGDAYISQAALRGHSCNILPIRFQDMYGITRRPPTSCRYMS